MPVFSSSNQKGFTEINTTNANAWRAPVHDLTSRNWVSTNGGTLLTAVEYDCIYRDNNWVYSVIQALVESTVLLPVKVLKYSDGAKSVDDSSPYAKLIARPSNVCNPVEFYTYMYSMYHIHGMSVAAKERDSSGKVVALRRVHPGRVRYGQRPGDPVNRWWLTMNDGTEQPVNRRDLVIVSRFNPESDRVGMSPLKPLRATIDNESMARLANSAMWRNGGKPSFVLSGPGKWGDAKPLAMQRLATQFKDKHGGVEQWGMPLVLEQGMQAIPLTVDNDLQYTEVRRTNRQEFIAAYGLPPSALGVLDGSTYSNVKESERALYRRALPSHIKRFESAFEFDLRDGTFGEVIPPEFGPDNKVEWMMDGVLRGAWDERIQALSTAVQNGLMTVNEARAIDNRAPVEGGDETVVNQAMAPMDMLTQQRVANAASSNVRAPSFLRQEKDTLLGRLSRQRNLADVDVRRLGEGLQEQKALFISNLLSNIEPSTPIEEVREIIKGLSND